MTDLRFPTGRFTPPEQPSRETRATAIDVIEETPALMRRAIEGLDEDQLDTPYREGGWTIRQVVHHVPDSHLNAYIRLKLALTEPAPVIKPYDENAWAELIDSTAVPVDVSLNLLDAVHRRWVAILRHMSDEDFRREYVHPETGRHALDHLLALYAWHGPHHIAHVTGARARMGW